jgi:hypothetical protein
MDKVVLIEIAEEVFRPLGFKRKGSRLTFDNGTLIKVIVIEKSNFGHSFFIDYGIIVKAIPLEGSQNHFGFRLGDILSVVQIRSDLQGKVKKYLEGINSEDDVLRALRDLPTLNIVPLRVREYFGLPVD